MKKDQYVVKRGEKWAVVGANNERATRITDTQREAIEIARRIAINQQSEMIVQGRNGKWHRCNSYGNDFCPPKDINY